jgi:hypothetical protein
MEVVGRHESLSALLFYRTCYLVSKYCAEAVMPTLAWDQKCVFVQYLDSSVDCDSCHINNPFNGCIRHSQSENTFRFFLLLAIRVMNAFNGGIIYG